MENKYITVAYKLYVMQEGQKTLVEEATVEHPFQCISGLGTTLERLSLIHISNNNPWIAPIKEPRSPVKSEVASRWKVVSNK